MNYEQANQYSLFVYPSLCNDDLESNQSWSPFSTPSISPYGSPPQSNFQYSSVINPNRFNQHNDNLYIPAPIGTASVFNTTFITNQHNQTNPIYVNKRLPKRSEQIDRKEFMQSISKQNKTNRVRMCTFCKSNGENEMIYTSHSLKSSINKISCPILMKYTCVECGATGENTHTIKYCPAMQKKLRRQMLEKYIKSKN